MSILLYSSVCLILIYLLYRLTVFVNHQADLYEQLKHFPGPKINSKLFGNLDILQKMAINQESVSKEIYYKLTELCDTYGRENGFFRLYLGPCTPWIVICDPMLAKKVLSSPQHFNKAHYYRLLDISCFGNILLSMSAKKARHERRDIIDHFSMFSLDTYITQMEGHLDKLVAKIDECIVQQDGQYHHVNVLVSTFVSDTLEENLFSTKSTSLESAIEPDHSVANEYLFRQTDIALLQPWRYLCANPILGWIVNLFNCQFFSYSLPTMAGIYRLHEVVWCLVLSRYCQLKKAIKQGETKESPSFIDDLLISRVFSQSNLVSKMFAFTGIIRQTIMMLTAGHDTTTSTLSWLLYLLAQYPEVQKKAREEVEQFLSNCQKMARQLPTQ